MTETVLDIKKKTFFCHISNFKIILHYFYILFCGVTGLPGGYWGSSENSLSKPSLMVEYRLICSKAHKVAIG